MVLNYCFPHLSETGELSPTPCQYRGAEVPHGELWQVNRCKFCKCEFGKVSCATETCPLLTCSNSVKVPGQCCRICHGMSAGQTGHQTQQNVSGFWSWVGFIIDAVTFFYFGNHFSPNQWNTLYIYWKQTKFPIHKVWWQKKGRTNQADIHIRIYFYVKKLFKTQRCRIPIDSAILAAFRHRFIAKKKKFKNAVVRVWGDVCGDQKQETFFCGLYVRLIKLA